MSERQQSIDLLNATHQFPTHVTIKVIGANSTSFVGLVVAAIRESLEHDEDPPHRYRETPSGRHVAVTVEPWILEAEQVLVVYERLRSLNGVVMLL